MDVNPLLSIAEFQDYLTKNRSLPKYLSHEESKIPHAYWNLDRTSIDRCLKDIANSVTGLMKHVPQDDKELAHLRKTAERLPQIDRGPTTKVALIGSQGAGKSLLVNALFDFDGLSLTGADGAACTASVVRYSQYSSATGSDSDPKFVADVRFLDVSKIETLINEHARSYYYFQHDVEVSDDDDGPGTRTAQQDEIDGRLKDTAEEIFTTLFGSRESFLDAWTPSDYRNGEFSQLCQTKSEEAIQDLGVNSQRVKTFVGKTPQELLEKIMPFLIKVQDEVCLWPLVDCVSIKFDHELLKHGIELIDLPGTGDSNVSRAQHADDVKDSVDVELILADTIRLTTDDHVINTARSGILNHGAPNVKILATKIDQISENQLKHCKGERYDHIHKMIQEAEEAATQAEENDDLQMSQAFTRHKTYLHRCFKQTKVAERAESITNSLTIKLEGRSPTDVPQIFHISAAEYMEWVKREKIVFRDQPSLPPEMTGIPSVRRYLYDLPARRNLEAYSFHVNVIMPAFIDKVKRVASLSGRDANFGTIADSFDRLRLSFMKDLLLQTRSSIRSFSKTSIIELRANTRISRQQIDSKIRKKWLTLKGQTFTKVLKSRGHVPLGTSRAKGLELGCTWNVDLAQILIPGFKKWFESHTEAMRLLKEALVLALDRIYPRTLSIIENAATNLVKMIGLMNKVIEQDEKFFRRATMEDERENNIIAAMTGPIFDEIYHALPELKPATKKTKSRFATSKSAHQKKVMENMFLRPDNHFVDKLINKFHELLDARIDGLVTTQFEEINLLLDGYSTSIREHANINCSMNPLGKRLREELQLIIPSIEEQAAQLQAQVPKLMKNEEEHVVLESFEESQTGNEGLEYFISKANKRKKAGDRSAKTPGSAVKKIKQEPS